MSEVKTSDAVTEESVGSFEGTSVESTQNDTAENEKGGGAHQCCRTAEFADSRFYTACELSDIT